MRGNYCSKVADFKSDQSFNKVKKSFWFQPPTSLEPPCPSYGVRFSCYACERQTVRQQTVTSAHASACLHRRCGVRSKLTSFGGHTGAILSSECTRPSVASYEPFHNPHNVSPSVAAGFTGRQCSQSIKESTEQ